MFKKKSNKWSLAYSNEKQKIICDIYVNKYTCNGICELGTFQEVSFPFQIQCIDYSTFSHFLFFFFFFLSHMTFPYWISSLLTFFIFYFSFSHYFFGSLHVLIFFSHRINFFTHLLHHLFICFSFPQIHRDFINKTLL